MTDTIIDVSHIAKTYYTEAGALPVLHDVNLTVQRGEFIAIMGASGSGKSTFMNLLGCLDGANQGEYLLANQAVSKLSKDQLAHLRNKVIGFVFQGFNLLSRTTLADARQSRTTAFCTATPQSNFGWSTTTSSHCARPR